MQQIIIQLAGGIGMFLLGMSLMTDSLKAMAGESLRQWLGRFTGSPFKAMMSGIGFTLVVQSSTATTLATIGFVSAGVLSFTQAIGVIIGANIGTTSTGWMVALLGLKFSVSMVALPMVGVGAMMKLLGKNTVALLGLALAGFGLLFIGIDFLQSAMAGFAEQVDLARWSNNDVLTRLILVLIGIVMTILLQSSSAAITATLAALAGGAIDMPQALTLVIGQNIGTVATAVLAAIGATVSAKRTAAVHVVFNVLTAVVAFFVLMPLLLWQVRTGWLQDWDNVLVIALFHTAFSIMGAMIFMPFTRQFQWVLERMIPERIDGAHTLYLDESLFSVPAVAISAAKSALNQTVAATLSQLVKACRGEMSGTAIDVAQLDDCLQKVDEYLNKMPVPQSQADQEKLMRLLQLIVYIRVIREDLIHAEFIDVLHGYADASLMREVTAKFEQLAAYLTQEHEYLPSEFVASFVQFGDSMKAQKTDVRLAIIEYSAHTQTHAADALNLIVARRWLDRLVKHTAKMLLVLESPKIKHEMI
ncbi:Na/Pi symporter [Moraxella sp. FZLJ2107]|uniref:Na/Pi cotransporter family protein n=1 Tax=unclassified Moraxella TaxID=2685852 RepID=UPI0020C8650E|nr:MULTISPECIES: Na/Pi symporter [unclassified Moraxella]UTO05209.1 Na/Pi symporter [Moraxella sp. FZLJ2107]UTO21944.1 Na/Pi symporter [Moraxella sp. FZLJ2109]